MYCSTCCQIVQPRGCQNTTPGALVTLSAAYRFSEHWHARFHWNRVFTFNNTDADLFLAGIGYSFRE